MCSHVANAIAKATGSSKMRCKSTTANQFLHTISDSSINSSSSRLLSAFMQYIVVPLVSYIFVPFVFKFLVASTQMHRSASILLSACSLRSSACKQIQRGFRTSCPVHCTASGDGTGNDLTNPPKTTSSFGTCRECGGVLKPAPTLTRKRTIFNIRVIFLFTIENFLTL